MEERRRSEAVDVSCSSSSFSVLNMKLWRRRPNRSSTSSRRRSISIGSAKDIFGSVWSCSTASPKNNSISLIGRWSRSSSKSSKNGRAAPNLVPEEINSIDIEDVPCHSGANFSEQVHSVDDCKMSRAAKRVAMEPRQLTLSELQKLVAKVKSEADAEQRWQASEEIRRLAREDSIARVTLAMLGVISPLIEMLDSSEPRHQSTAMLALLNLATGNETNKAAIVKARALPKMVPLLRNSGNPEVQSAVVTAFLSLSAFDGNKALIGSTAGAVTGLVNLLSSPQVPETRRKDALRALYNLSIHPSNVSTISEAGAVPLLLAMVEDVEMAHKALATLSNFAATEQGRNALTKHKEILYAVLIDAIRWSDAPKCQERAAYILMMIAHHSQLQREAMANAGAISALLELCLLGTPLAQKRASRTLESFRKSKAFSAPQLRQKQQMLLSERGRTMSERRVVDVLVRQSLNRTMQRIVKRANLDGGTSDLTGTASSTASPSASAPSRRQRRLASSSSLPY